MGKLGKVTGWKNIKIYQAASDPVTPMQQKGISYFDGGTRL